MTSSSDRWEQVKEVLHRAMQLAPEERPGFLDEACSSNHALRAEVESLLRAGEEVRSSFLQSPPQDPNQDEILNETQDQIKAASLSSGQIFAERFQLVRRLGEGGMGQVWLADQTFPVRRQVALKLIKAGMYDDAVVHRFESERQSLAIMDHPAIAKVFDAGTTPLGQPYFVMEYVPGLPITEYCDQKKLKISERLELFIQVCEAVQHAHQKAILHRDLKPANILVVEVDGKPVPRIIDFGLAKATTPLTAGESLFTQFGHLVGTPGYMSPEQADPNVQDIDTRSDVYSLGVVLYVLLTGAQPFDAKQWKHKPLDEMLRRLRDEEPLSPSNRVGADRATSAANAEARGTEPRQLASLLRGDLDWITMKALEKERGRRYSAPSDLAADLRRYLSQEPVLARPASAGYQLRKYVRRHRIAVGIAAALIVLLAAFSILQAVELRRATRERDRANRERDRATRITDFMTGMFKVSNPSQARGNSVTAREILDKASNDIGAGLARDPEAQSQMMFVMATTYLSLGLYARAHELAQRALDSRVNQLGPDDPKTLESRSLLGWILDREGDLEQGEKMERQALSDERRVLGSENPDTLLTENDLGYILYERGKYPEAEKLDREALEIQSRTRGSEDPQTLTVMNYLSEVLGKEGGYAEAEKLDRETLDIRRRTVGAEHPATLVSMLSLAMNLDIEGKFPEAEKLDRDCLEIERRVLGPDHPDTVATMDNLADVVANEGRYPQAEKLLRETLDIQRRLLGPDHPGTLNSAYNLATVLDDEGRYAEAESLERETLKARQRVLGPKHPDTLRSMYNLACFTARNGKRDEALSLLREALDSGYKNPGVSTDPDLQSLHGDPRFDALAARAGSTTAAAQ